MEELLEIFKDTGMLEGLMQTVYMVVASTVISYILGLCIGVTLIVTDEAGIAPNKWVNKPLSIFVNLSRSIPFIILLVVLIPVTRWIVGTSIGSTAMIVPLSFAATSFVGRLVETTLKEIDKGIIEQAKCMGATPLQIVFRFYLVEATPALVRGLSITGINLIGYSAMAGTVAGGGLGDIAIRHGYYRYDYRVMFITVVILVILVQVIQVTIDRVSKKIDKKNK